MWSIVDVNARTTIPVASIIQNNEDMQPYQKLDTDLSFTKIRPIQNPSLDKEFEVRYNDIDVNGHANNGNYIIWALEPLSFEFKSTHKIKTMDMMYKKEAKFGDKLTSQIEFLDENTTVHVLKNMNGEELCLVQINWVQKAY